MADHPHKKKKVFSAANLAKEFKMAFSKPSAFANAAAAKKNAAARKRKRRKSR